MCYANINETKEEIETQKCCGIYYIKTMERIASVVRKTLGTKSQVLKELYKLD